ncbi:MAG: hypothetical protein RTU92_14140 [Candidatus Thorarchaeota archaeon]
MSSIAGALEFGKNWYGMLKHLADAESIVDVYLCSNAFGNIDDREKMVTETHGVRIVYVGEDYFIVGPRRPIASSIIPMGWISMIRVHEDGEFEDDIKLIDSVDGSSLATPDEPE